MNEIKKVFKWWWPWQMEKIETMLEGMAAGGWILISASASCTGFTFEKREPARVRYCLDYQEKVKPEYLGLLEDAGWTMVYKGSGWYIWSRAYEDDRPELYTDRESLMRRNNTILTSLGVVLAAQFPLFIVALDKLGDRSPVAIGLIIFWGLISGILAGITIGMAVGSSRIKRLSKVYKP